ncbi:hypothetical protein JXB31_00545 [Candidatus Woesearchaeota archaeon]|nr:hypothetical protein [Candidatus Woesearchaeota archaeon]
MKFEFNIQKKHLFALIVVVFLCSSILFGTMLVSAAHGTGVPNTWTIDGAYHFLQDIVKGDTKTSVDLNNDGIIDDSEDAASCTGDNICEAINLKVSKNASVDGNMTVNGNIIADDPLLPNHVATMAYVDALGGGSGGCMLRSQEFKSSGTWTKPAGVETVEVLLVAGGGGGGGSSMIWTAEGGGGGGGGEILFARRTVSGDVSVTIGSGGSGGTAGSTTKSGGAGGTGGNSCFGSFCAEGGKGGGGSFRSTAGNGGNGGGPLGGIGGHGGYGASSVGSTPAGNSNMTGFSVYYRIGGAGGGGGNCYSPLGKPGGRNFLFNTIGGCTIHWSCGRYGGSGGASYGNGALAGSGSVGGSAAPNSGGGGGAGCRNYAGGAGGSGYAVVYWCG